MRALHLESDGTQGDQLLTASLCTSPYIDFVKDGFSFTETSKITNNVKGLELKKDLLVVSWQGLIGKSKVGKDMLY